MRRLLPLLVTASLWQACKSTSPGGIPVSADPASLDSVAACALSGLPNSSVKRIGISFSNPSAADESLRVRLADAFTARIYHDPRFRVIERERLDAVLREQGMTSSGVMSGEQASKIGGILPIDWILTASVTRDGSQGSAGGRFIDVVSGEMVHAFDCGFTIAQTNPASNPTVNQNAVNNSVVSSVQNSNNTQTNINIGILNVTDPDRFIRKKCDSVHAPVIAKLRDLTSGQKVDDAASAAMRIPFDMDCGQIHFLVMDTFERYQFAPPGYETFLLRTLQGIDDVSEDSRTFYILKYFAATGNRVDSAEWDAGFRALSRSRRGSLGGYLSYLLNNKRDPASSAARAAEVLRLADANRLGRPVAFPPFAVYVQVMAALKFENSEQSRSFLSVLADEIARYAPEAGEQSGRLSLVSQLTLSYPRLEGDGRRTVAAALLTLYQAQKPEERFYEKLFFELLYPIERASNGEDGEKAEKREAARLELASLNQQFQSVICQAPELYDRPRLSTRVDQIHYLLRSGVPCPALPTAVSLAREMENGDWDDKAEAAGTLVEMRAHASAAEPVVLRYFQIDGMSRSGEIRAYCAQILGNIRSSNPAAHTLLIAASGDFDSSVQQRSQEALGRIGLSAKNAILAYLRQPRSGQELVRESRRRMALMEVLGRMGKGAADAIPVLDVFARSDVDSYLRQIARNAIVNIQEDRHE